MGTKNEYFAHIFRLYLNLCTQTHKVIVDCFSPTHHASKGNPWLFPLSHQAVSSVEAKGHKIASPKLQKKWVVKRYFLKL